MVKSAPGGANPSSPPRCGARTRRGGTCQTPPVRGKKRCRMHGGLSTGPRTPEGLERSRRARWRHGRYSREAREARRIANLETVEAAKERFARESRRGERQSCRDVRRIMRALDRWLPWMNFIQSFHGYADEPHAPGACRREPKSGRRRGSERVPGTSGLSPWIHNVLFRSR